VYYFESTDYTLAELEQLKNQMKEGLVLLKYEQVELTLDIHTEDYNFIILNGFTSKLGSEGMSDLLEENAVTLKEWSYFPISKENYSILQIYKNMDEYLKLQ